MSGMLHNRGELASINVPSFITNNVTDMSRMFCCCSLKSIDLSKFNTDKVTDMNSMFSSFCSLKSIVLSNFNTDKVT